MGKKLTLGEAQQEFIDRNLIPLFDEYKNNREKLLAQTQEGYLIIIRLDNLKQNKKGIFNKFNPHVLYNIKLWCKLNNKLFELIDNQEYKGHDKILKWKCLNNNCGEVFEACWHTIYQNSGCSFCRGFQVNLFNCLATKRPDLIKYLKNKEDGYKYTSQSRKDIIAICPDCGNEKKIIINRLSNQGFSCSKCGDGVSYPEKFVFNILDQLNLDYKIQLSKTIFNWCNNYRYDFYIKYYDCIIETHGAQHYTQMGKNYWGYTLEEIQENDKIKKELALNNSIKNYIVIDCRHSEVDWIKNNIMQSELPQLLNFKEEDIDWLKCHEYACNSLVKITCNLWNEGLNKKEIMNKLKISNGSVKNYLRQGFQLNICDYNPEAELKKNGQKNGSFGEIKIICLYTNEVFKSITDASNKYNIRIKYISDCCKGKRDSAGKHPVTGEKMVWIYYEDWEEIQDRLTI